MERVLVSDQLSEAGLALLRGRPSVTVDYAPGISETELAARIADVDALVVRSGSKVTAKVIDGAKKLRVIGRAGIGVDNVDVDTATRRGILVMNTPTGNAVTTAEHTLALLMSLARRIPQATASLKSMKWEKSKFMGRELAGKTLGVLGLGNVGRIVADRAKGLHMHVVAFDPVISAERAAQLGVELVSLPQLFARSDAITAHTPLTKDTRGIVDDAAIATMKKGVLLVNCARGGIYDEGALQRGLESGKLGGVALDVFVTEPPLDHPLLGLENVIATPHLGASTEEAQERVALEICRQVVAYLDSGTVVNAVNAPNVPQDVVPRLAAYLDLARRLGRFVGQIERAPLKALEVECAGEPAELGPRAVARAAVAGLLSTREELSEASLNDVSALHLAQESGIAVSEVQSPRSGPYLHRIRLRVEDESGAAFTVEGHVAPGGRSRLNQWRNWELNAELRGCALVLLNANRPGVVGSVGSILGRRHINISQVHLGLDPSTDQAISVWTVDSPIPSELLGEIQQAQWVSRAMAIDLR